MYKKSAELVHLHERTGSHATKGTGRGTVPHMTVPDPEAFDRRELVLKRRLLDHQISAGIGACTAAVRIINEAVERGDAETVRAVRRTMRAFSRSVEKLKDDRSRIKDLLKDHPPPLLIRKPKKPRQRKRKKILTE